MVTRVPDRTWARLSWRKPGEHKSSMRANERQPGSGFLASITSGRFVLHAAIVILYVGGVLCGGYYGLSHLHHDLITQRGANLARTAAAMAQSLDAFFLERVGELELLSNYPGIRDGAHNRAAQSLQRYIRLSKYFSTVHVIGPEGSTVAATGVDKATTPSTAWLREVQQTGRPSLRAPWSPSSEVVTVAIPVARSGGRGPGVLSGTIPVEAIHRVLHERFVVHEKASRSRNWVALDPMGVVVTDHPVRDSSSRDLRKLGQASVIRASDSSISEGQFVEELDARTQVPVVTGFARLRNQGPAHEFGWTVLVQADREVLYGPVHRFLWVVGSAFAILAAIVGYLGLGTLQGMVVDTDQQGSVRRPLLGPTYYDSVTGLPGDRLFEMILGQAIERVSPARREMALLMFDLKQLKVVSDSQGQARGDLAVRVLAARVKSCVRMSDTVARIGADRFAVLLENLSAPDDAAAIAQKILQTVVLPLTLGSEEILVDTCIGVALHPSDAAAAKPLMARAEEAMEAAHADGLPISFYAKAQGNEIFESLAKESEGDSVSPPSPSFRA